MADRQLQSKADAWLNDKGSKLVCAACGKRDWLARDLIPMRPMPSVNPAEAASAVPEFLLYLALACRGCGYAVFVEPQDVPLWSYLRAPS
jgi:hypothetical protein